ncbi:MAG TPA: DUF177 domain-containing protein [Stellaceae bacterium]|nr:DUF177 domain-containing protein [Stellaceae bacterium]
MKAAAPEFSRPIPLARLGRDPFRQDIEATPQERDKLARRFGLLALDRLFATVTLSRQDGASVLLEAAFEAEFVQECVISLEPVRGTVHERFSLLYGPAAEAEDEIALDSEEVTFEPMVGDAIDVAEAVAQELSLALPEFPRDPQAAVAPVSTADAEERPFAALTRWRRKDGG